MVFKTQIRSIDFILGQSLMAPHVILIHVARRKILQNQKFLKVKMGKIWHSSLSQAFVYDAPWAFFGSDNGNQPLVCHLLV